jgi:hypothetical protein
LEHLPQTDVNSALSQFSQEAALYCQGISDPVARDYATEYSKFLEGRAKRIDIPQPRIPAGLFEPNRNLIRSTLDGMYQKHFGAS